MDITPLGTAGEVTGSAYLVESISAEWYHLRPVLPTEGQTMELN